MDYASFRKAHPAVRNFQRYDSTTRAMHAASHRLGYRQRAAVGQFFYTHPLCGDSCFDTAKMATTLAYEAYTTAKGISDACAWLEAA